MTAGRERNVATEGQRERVAEAGEGSRGGGRRRRRKRREGEMLLFSRTGSLGIGLAPGFRPAGMPRNSEGERQGG